jgi:signal transduction histidine kinase
MFALIPFLLFTFFSPRVNVLVTLVLAATALCISLLLAAVFYRWLPPAVALLAVVMSYLLWSSRRLQNTVNYLGSELAHLNSEMAGREVDLSKRAGSAFNFLEKLLPLKGWYLADAGGDVKYSSGSKPGLAAALPSHGTWINEGDQSWTSLVEDRHKLEVGLRWTSSDGPTSKEMEFLNKFLGQFATYPEHNEHESREVVEKLITQIQGAIVSLNTMHRFFDDCIAQMADGLLVTNELGKVLFANNRAAAYLQGHTISNPAGMDIFRLLDNLDAGSAEACKGLLQEAYLECSPASINLVNRDGLDLLLHITPLSGGKTGIGGVIITLSDISHLKANERARNETISFVSHDLRSPLVSILALLELAKNSDSPGEIQRLHKRIGEYTQLTISMAEQFIQLARVESDAEIKLVDMDLVSVAVNAYELVWLQAQSRKINLVREIRLDHAWVKGDAGLLERAVTNLLNNAIKYSPEGGTVCMKLFGENGNFCCCIQDQGYGIPEDQLPSLFDRFHCAHRNSGVDAQGIGLGLALVKATVERHGGDIHVVSKEGKGSRFCLLLPEFSLEE